MKQVYLSKNVYLAEITNPKFVLDSNILGHYEQGNIILTVPVYKKEKGFYNLLNNEVYSDDPQSHENVFTICTLANLNTEKKLIDHKEIINKYEKETKKNIYKLQIANYFTQKYMSFYINDEYSIEEINEKHLIINQVKINFLNNLDYYQDKTMEEFKNLFIEQLEKKLYPGFTR